MRVLEIRTHGFRNLSAAPVHLGSGVNLFLGANGQGKTNFLEAVFLLATLKSFRGATRLEMQQSESTPISIVARVDTNGLEKEIELLWSKSSRQLKVNGTPVQDLVAHFKAHQCVSFSPEDLGILDGSPKIRRRFMDRLVFQCHPKHLLTVQRYQRILKQRNELLRQKRYATHSIDAAEMQIWTEQLIHQSASVTAARLELLGRMNEKLSGNYSRIAGMRLEPGILNQKSQIRHLAAQDGAPGGIQAFGDLAAYYQHAAERVRAKEPLKGVTLFGAHLEDYNLFYGPQHRAHSYASMGQKKTLLLALRLTELELVMAHAAEPPCFLLDDLSAELDENRLASLMTLLREIATADLQIFVTAAGSTSPGKVWQPLLQAAHVFTVQAGEMALEPTAAQGGARPRLPIHQQVVD